MNGIIRILLVTGIVVPWMCATAAAETREERKLRIERKYLFEQQEVVLLNLELPDDSEEDPFGRDPDFKTHSEESLAAGSGMLRRRSVSPVRRAASFLDSEEGSGLFGEEVDSEISAVELRRQKLDENWDHLMEDQRTRGTERSSSPGNGGLYSSGSSGYAYGSSTYSTGTQPSSYGGLSDSTYSYGDSSFSQTRTSPSFSSSPLSSTTRDSEGSGLSITRSTPTPSTASAAWSISSSDPSPSSVSAPRSSTLRSTTPTFSSPSMGREFRGSTDGLFMDLDRDL